VQCAWGRRPKKTLRPMSVREDFINILVKINDEKYVTVKELADLSEF
jgi:hypothetical protein